MEKMIKRWLNLGMINQEIATVLLEDVKCEQNKIHKLRLNICIYTIAAIFIGIGIIAFISANDWILSLFKSLPILKILLMLIVTCVFLFFGYKLAYEDNRFSKLGHSMIFLSTLLIGGTYALIGQSYHINANNSFLMFLWLFSILPVAYIFKNFAINIVTIIIYILGTIFYYLDLSLDTGLTWTIFIPILLGTTLYSIGNIPVITDKFNKFSMSYKLTGLASLFVTLLILTCSVEDTYQQTSLCYIMPIILLIGLNFINLASHKNQNSLFKIEMVFLQLILTCLLLLMLLPNISIPVVMILANIAIITMISVGYNYGYKFLNNALITLTNWFLVIYCTVNYCRWGWNMMDKALFFILGGVCLLIFGMFLENKRKKIITKDK